MRNEPLKLTYETRCRRCGEMHEWSFGGGTENLLNEKNWLKLHKWVSEHLDCPSVNRCDICDKSTIQDYVSYTGKGGQ